MAALRHIDHAGRERLAHEGVSLRKAVLASITEVQGPHRACGTAAAVPQEAPYSTLLVRLRKGPGIPGRETRCRADLGDQLPVTEVRRKKAKSVIRPRVRGRIVQSKEAAERDTGEPDRAATGGTRRRHDLARQALDRAAVAYVLELDPNELQIDRETAFSRHGIESGPQEIIRPLECTGEPYHTYGRHEPGLRLVKYSMHGGA